MEQARKAFDNFVGGGPAGHERSRKGRAQTARSGAMDVSGRAMTFAERNMAASFEFAQNLGARQDAGRRAASADRHM